MLWDVINPLLLDITSSLKPDQVKELPRVKIARETCKALGADPDRYRVSSEALLRRVVQGKGLYKINNIVDINNYISLVHHLPVGSYALESIKPPIMLRIGEPGETYQGIGQHTVKANGLPVLADAIGPFGSPYSDSSRTLITLDTSELMMVIYAFSGKQDLDDILSNAEDMLKEYASASGFESFIYD
jgi:DNA/RNA-binding domain of Phe-tRNA-synthetase-like protein